MNKMKKFGKRIRTLGELTIFVSMFYYFGVCGTYEVGEYIGEPKSFGWLVNQVLIAVSVIALGAILCKISNEIIKNSSKRFVRVWIRNTTSNKTKSKLVEEDGQVVLAEDEKIQRIGSKVYCFR